MRPEISPYGHTYMHTPNMQDLADEGYTFRRMYVQQALCAPSRTVLLTGRRPDTSHVWTIGPFFRDVYGKDYVTLPQYFKQHGFVAAGAGKIFHTGGPSGLIMNYSNHPPTIIRQGDDQPASWSLPYIQSSDTINHWPQGSGHKKGAPLSNGGVDQPIENFNDARNAYAIIDHMRNLTANGTKALTKPFFLACGFHR